MTLRALTTDLHVLNMRTRMPFKYGIATLTALPHLFVRVQLEVDGRTTWGIAADGLPPKWFTKNPDTSFRDDLAEMLHVIESARGFVEQIGNAATVFDLWQNLYNQQMRWAVGEGYPPLLWNFGVSLVERAAIDAHCRAAGATFARALRDNTLGIHLGELHSELADNEPADLLPAKPLRKMIVRHTVGLGDPLTDDDIPDADRIDDGLPQSLVACIRTYGLTHFKIKIGGDADRDIDRLTRLASLLDEHCPDNYAFTLDGNEQYRSAQAFREMWQALVREPKLADFLARLIFVEQPLHRDVALSNDAADELTDWDDRPPIIIDESDASIGSLPDALDAGYVGTSYKSCKGVFKGIANACLIAHLRRSNPDNTYAFSGEDLCNVGPVALVEDTAVAANLGIEHAERNGHHYLAGLSMLPDNLQQQVLDNHGDLYRRHEKGWPTLNVRNGAVNIGTVVDAPLGPAFNLDPTAFTPLDQWTYESLESR